MPTSLTETRSPSPRGDPGPGKDPLGLSLLERVLALDHSVYNHLHEDVSGGRGGLGGVCLLCLGPHKLGTVAPSPCCDH